MVELAQIVANNAQWCDAVCRSHGLETAMTDNGWICRDQPPPFYPGYVSLSGDADPVMAEITELVSQSSAAGLGPVKDSFDNLDLSALGYEKLLEARWYAGFLTNLPTSADASRVTGAQGLSTWLAAWDPDLPEDAIFLAGLLSMPAVSFYLGEDGHSGLAAYRCDKGILGISNLFGRDAGLKACLSALVADNPDCLVAGYGDEAEIDGLSAMRIDPLAPLSIWLPEGEYST